MAKKTQPKNRLPDSLRNRLQSDATTFGTPKLTKVEVDALRAFVMRGSDEKGAISLGRAARFLAGNDKSDDSAKAIAALLSDPEKPDALRRQAAALLGTIPGKQASAALTATLKKTDARLEFAILGSLARVGDEKALAAILKLPKTDKARLQTGRDFAATTIAFREGVKLPQDRLNAIVPPGEAVEIKDEAPEAVAEAIKSLGTNTFGIPLSKKRGFCYMCGDVKHMVLLNAEIDKATFAKSVRKSRMIAGLIVADDPAVDGHIVRRLIFAEPSRTNIRLTIVTPTGDIAYLGELTPGEKGYDLRLSDHAAERIPTQVSGTLDDRGMLSLTARNFAATAPAQRPGELAVAD